MNRLFFLVLFTAITFNVFGQSSNKITFTIKGCTYSTNNKDYKPCQEDVTNRFIVLDMDNDKWIFYTAKTKEYKIIKKEKSKYENTSLNQITFQVIDEKNDPLLLIYLYGKNDDGTSVYRLFRIAEQTNMYNLLPF